MRSNRFLWAAAWLGLCACNLEAASTLGTMSATIDGTEWSAMSGTTYATAPTGLKSITITGSNSGVGLPVNTLTLQVEGEGIGTYVLDSSKNVLTLAGATRTYKAAAGGKIVLTQFGATVDGTFEGTALSTDGSPSLTVAQGHFSAPKR